MLDGWGRGRCRSYRMGLDAIVPDKAVEVEGARRNGIVATGGWSHHHDLREQGGWHVPHWGGDLASSPWTPRVSVDVTGPGPMDQPSP